MSRADPQSGSQQTPSHLERIDRECDRFEAAWRGGSRPRIEDFLQAAALDAAGCRQLLAELVLLDLDYSWRSQAGAAAAGPTQSAVRDTASAPARPLLEHYVERFPEMGPLEQLGEAMILGEYKARCRWAEPPSHAEYLQRFPSRAASLTACLIEADRQLRKESQQAVLLEPWAESLVAAGLATGEKLADVCQTLTPDQRSQALPAIAPLLAEKGAITAYQAEKIAGGRMDELLLGTYVILDKLGAGGMGEVFKAWHRPMERVVAVKMLPTQAVRLPEAVKRFQNEAKAAARLIHANIVTALDAGEHQGKHFLVMEFIEGRDLGAIVKDRGPLPFAQAVHYVLQAARGLNYAHKRGVIHRDIKPGNLLLDREGNVKVLDMGLARLLPFGPDAPESDRLTDSGQMMGTCDYMAPEQAASTRRVDQRTDIYALGCTLYRLITGEVMYGGESAMQVLLAHRELPIPSLAQARPEVPSGLDAVYRKMVAKQPEDRYQSMAEVIAELKQFDEAGHDDREASDSSTGRGPSAAGSASRTGEPGRDAPSRKTSRSLVTRVMSAAQRRRPRLAVPLAALLAIGLLLALGIAIRFRMVGNGRETAREMPEGRLVTVAGSTNAAVTLPSATGMAVSGSGAAGPRPAAAPFDAAAARRHQESWATRLGVSVEVQNSLGMKLMLIPAGEFMMGSPESAEELAAAYRPYYAEVKPANFSDEYPCHRVRITKPYFLGAYEVTVGQFRRFTSDTNYRTEAEKDGKGGYGIDPSSDLVSQRPEYTWQNPGFEQTDEHPVLNVSWNDASEFCRWLSGKDGKTYGLPTEAQWEYACRAGTLTRYANGDDLERLAEVGNAADATLKAKLPKLPWSWYVHASDGYAFSAPVGRFHPNAFGLYDMHGNASEWCADWYGGYAANSTDDPVGPDSGNSRVLRGGSWLYGWPYGVRSAVRAAHVPSSRALYTGFRVARTP